MGAFETLKALRAAAIALPAAKENSKIMDLVNAAQNEVFELRKQTLDLQQENADLRKAADTEKRRQELIASLEHDGTVYRKEERPYCVACVHEKSMLIPLSQRGNNYTGAICPVCGGEYGDVYTDSKPRSLPQVRY